jgi:hypothetical protein
MPPLRLLVFSMCVTLLSLLSALARSQDSFETYDHIYGLDQALCNGRKYIYEAPAGTKGNQYFASPAYYNGSVTLRGKCYQQVWLNYDIVNQQLLMRYVDEMGSLIVIEVSAAWLEGFKLDSLEFAVLNQDKKPLIYQAIGTAPVRFLYRWYKNLDLDNTVGNLTYKFSRPFRESFLDQDGRLRPFHSNRGLVRLFSSEKRGKIRDFIHKQGINVKKSSDRQMTDLINFIGNLR